MSMNIPLTIKVNCHIGLSAVSPARAESIATCDLLFYADTLFWLISLAGSTGQHGGVNFRNYDLYDALGHVGDLGRAILTSARDRLEEIESLAGGK